jgi:hypothetical protein
LLEEPSQNSTKEFTFDDAPKWDIPYGTSLQQSQDQFDSPLASLSFDNAQRSDETTEQPQQPDTSNFSFGASLDENATLSSAFTFGSPQTAVTTTHVQPSISTSGLSWSTSTTPTFNDTTTTQSFNFSTTGNSKSEFIFGGFSAFSFETPSFTQVQTSPEQSLASNGNIEFNFGSTDRSTLPPTSSLSPVFAPFDSPSICSMCCQPYESPLTLYCGHAYCSLCVEAQKSFFVLKNLHIFGELNELENITILCPLCNLPTVIDKNTPLPQYEVVTGPCFNPKCDNMATCECVTCAKISCDECFDKLHDLMGDHKKSVIGETVGFKCPKHHNLLEYYCNDCCQCICVTCANSLHGNHEVLKEEALLKYKEMLSNKTEVDQAIFELEFNVSNMDEQTQKSIQHIETAYEKSKQELQLRREESLKKVELTQHMDLVTTTKQIENIQKIKKHIDRLESQEGPTIFHKWDATRKLQARLLTSTLAPILSDETDTQYTHGVMAPPTLIGNTNVLHVSWKAVPNAVNYKLRWIFKSNSPPPLVLHMPGALGINMYGDASYGKKGIIVYDGPNTQYVLNGIRYHTYFSFTIECTDSQGRQFYSPVSKSYEVEPPRINFEILHRSDYLNVIVTGNAIMPDSMYSLVWRFVDKPSEVSEPVISYTGSFISPNIEIGRFIQYQVSCIDALGEQCRSPFSLPTLSMRVNLSQSIFSMTSALDILGYFRKYNISAKVTSYSQPLTQCVSLLHSRQWGTSIDPEGPYIMFDFTPYSVQLALLQNGPDGQWTLEGSDDGVTWHSMFYTSQYIFESDR